MSSSVRPRKQPRGNAAPNLLTQALNSGTVPQRAEKKRKRPSGKDGSSSEPEDLNRGTVSQRADENTQAVERSSEHSQRLLEEVRALGYFPKESGSGPDKRLLGVRRLRHPSPLPGGVCVCVCVRVCVCVSACASSSSSSIH